MARPPKRGLSYFPIDTGFFEDSKTLEIMDAYGAQSVSVLVYLLCNIYEKEGYYIRWDNGQSLLTARNLGIKRGAVHEVVVKATQVGFFDSGKYEEFGILTSRGIQKRYYEAVSNFRRKGLTVYRDFILFSPLAEFPQAETPVNATETPVNACNNPTDKIREDKSRLEEIREEEAPHASPISETVIKSASQLLGGMISPSQYQILESLSETYSEDWILSAIQIANERDRRALPYVRGILQRFAVQGGKDAPAPSKGRKSETAADCIERYMAAMQGR